MSDQGVAANHVALKTLGTGVYVESTYALHNPQVGTTRQGKPYLKCLVRDATGEVPARKWTFDPNELPVISETGFAAVSGHTQSFNGQIQLIIDGIRPVSVTESELALLLPSTSEDIDAMFADVQRILGTLEHPAMRALADAYLDDEELMRRFRQAPAATSNHHAWIGGLLEHTRQLLRLADVMLPLYPGLNRDLVLMGLFLHDLGKTSELSWERGFAYTAEGNLVGHVVGGAIRLQFMAAKAAKSGERLPGTALRVLQHILLSHHGRLEFGAAKVPATPEALFVSQLDDLDAKTTMGLCAVDRPGYAERASGDEPVAEFTENVWALGTRLYRPDPFEVGDA